MHDLNLDSMTLTYELDLDILKMDPYTKNEVSRSRLSKVKAGTETDARDRNITTPHSWVVIWHKIPPQTCQTAVGAEYAPLSRSAAM